jgi:ABC-type transporter Mla maintaining outer membrane lipid asymmetry ATPase subunit MlaF
VIRVQGLRKRFGAQEVLRGVDLDIATGEIMVVIGRSGGGKSVLLKHLIGLLRPDAGAVLVAAPGLVQHARNLQQRLETRGKSSRRDDGIECRPGSRGRSRS